MVNMIMSLLVLTDWQHRQTGYVYAGNLLLRTNLLYDMMTQAYKENNKMTFVIRDHHYMNYITLI